MTKSFSDVDYGGGDYEQVTESSGVSIPLKYASDRWID